MRLTRHSLRVRLLAAIGALVVVVLVAIGWTTIAVSRSAFIHVELNGRTPPPTERLESQIANDLEALWRQGGDLRDLTAIVAQRAAEARRPIAAVVLDNDGALLASAPPGAVSAARLMPDGTLTISGSSSGRVREYALRAPGTPLKDVRGQTRGRLFVVPRPQGAESSEAQFNGLVVRGVVGTAAVVGLVVLGLIAVLTRRMVHPLELLTDLAGRLGAGELSVRAEVEPRDDEVGHLARAFNAMADDLERQEQLRRRLLADIAHELRTPLTNVRCQIEAIQDGLLLADPGTVASLHEEVLSLSRLVDDLQVLALADAGRLELEPETFSVIGELEQIARACHRSTGPAIEVAPGPDLLVWADRSRFRQVVRNLVVNALAGLYCEP
jgi:HAMP domain-containing protein